MRIGRGEGARAALVGRRQPADHGVGCGGETGVVDAHAAHPAGGEDRGQRDADPGGAVHDDDRRPTVPPHRPAGGRQRGRELGRGAGSGGRAGVGREEVGGVEVVQQSRGPQRLQQARDGGPVRTGVADDRLLWPAAVQSAQEGGELGAVGTEADTGPGVHATDLDASGAVAQQGSGSREQGMGGVGHRGTVAATG